MKRPMALMIVALFVVFGAIFAFIEGKNIMIARYLADYTPPPVSVSAQAAREETWEIGIGAVGTLKAVRGVDIATETAGIITGIRFQPGDDVRAGVELVSLDDSIEVATLKSLVAQRRLAEINFERDQRLLGSKAISRTDYDKTEAQLKDISAQVEKTEAIIARKHLRAPFDGRIGIPLVEAGQYANEGDPIVTLQALDMLEVDFTLPEQQLPRLAHGQRVRCRVQAYPEQGFEGTISAIDAKVDGNTRNVLVRARVPNTSMSLLPGMFVSVEVLTDEAVQFVTVPETSVSYNLYGDSVFVIAERKAEDGATELVVERRYVTVGERRNRRVAVLEGLATGERVVTAGALKLDSGAVVVVDNSVDLVP
jgi:membrane fusion protein, multidrug efflux system